MVRRTLKAHVDVYMKRYPRLTRGANQRMDALMYIFLGYGTGYQFTKDGSLVNVYDMPDKGWEAEQKPKWLQRKQQWLEKIKDDENSAVKYNTPQIKKFYTNQIKKSKKLFGEYFAKFDPYKYEFEKYEPSSINKVESDKEVPPIELSDGYSLITIMPNNTKKEIIDGAIEVLNHLIQIKYKPKWATALKNRLEKRL